MQWSKRKKRVESLFSPSVLGRLELRATSYCGAHDDEGRGYITFDKKEIWSMCTIKFHSIEDDRINMIVERENITCYEAQLLADIEFKSEGIYNQYTYYKSLDEYCNNSLDKSLESDNLLVRCLAMLDRRLGKRRLQNINIENENSKVIEFYKIRCDCEGIKF